MVGLLIVCIVFFNRGRYRPDVHALERSELLGRLKEMDAESRKALIVKRVSEQLEEVAYQQKEISDGQRQEAMNRKEEAERMREKAEIEADKALNVRSEALG